MLVGWFKDAACHAAGEASWKALSRVLALPAVKPAAVSTPLYFVFHGFPRVAEYRLGCPVKAGRPGRTFAMLGPPKVAVPAAFHFGSFLISVPRI